MATPVHRFRLVEKDQQNGEYRNFSPVSRFFACFFALKKACRSVPGTERNNGRWDENIKKSKGIISLISSPPLLHHPITPASGPPNI